MEEEFFYMNINEIAETVLEELMQVHSDFKIDYEKRISKYKDKLRNKLIAGLTDQQKQVYEQIEDLFLDESCVESSKYFLFGMQVRSAIEKLCTSPKAVLELFYKDTELTSDDTKLWASDTPVVENSSGFYKNYPLGN